jgi:hypothetical protein
MPITVKDIKLLVRDLLRANWDNTSAVEPVTSDDIHTGWWDASKDDPQVTVTSEEEGTLDGGDTGITGIKGNGSGYVQHRNGTVLVDCWAGSQDDYDNRGQEQIQLQAMMDEVETIVFNNLQSLDGIDSVAITNRTKLVDEDADPSEHRCQFELTYNWTKQ